MNGKRGEMSADTVNKTTNPQARMRAYLQRVATGPELSKSLNQAQAEDAMSMILNGEIDAVRAGLFLIVLRMKRESEAENRGILTALIKKTRTQQTTAAQILAIADPFNGYLRGLSATPFLPAVFAASGLPTYTHGLEAVGPKYGITTRLVLEAAGKNVDRNLTDSVSCLDDGKVGWSYLDQRHYIPELHNLLELREAIVKRSCLSTLEVVLKPLSGCRSTHLMSGFVHKAYPPIYAMLAKQSGFDSAMIVRGTEGGCIPSLSQLSRYFGYQSEYADDADNALIELHQLDPKQLGIEQDVRMLAIPQRYAEAIKQTGFQNSDKLHAVVEHNLQLGLDALANNTGPMRDSLIYGVAIGLRHVGLASTLADGAERARKVIVNGAALRHFQAG